MQGAEQGVAGRWARVLAQAEVVWEGFRASHPRILGALCDAVCGALKKLPEGEHRPGRRSACWSAGRATCCPFAPWRRFVPAGTHLRTRVAAPRGPA